MTVLKVNPPQKKGLLRLLWPHGERLGNHPLRAISLAGRTWTILFVVPILILSLAGLPSILVAPASAAPSADAYELIDAVNALRASQGMGPLTIDPILMSIAQAQNDYSMSIGSVTHTGPNGSRPRERAYAAGYGGGATVFVSENIAQGTGLTPSEAVQWWTGDDPHWNTMMGANYRDIGAGAGCDGEMCYYTIDTGYVAGGTSADSTAPAAAQAPAAPSGALPVLQATPMPDGSIVHTVLAGQTLWTVSAVYELPLAELLELNGLTENSLLHPGDELLIRAATEVTATPTRAVTATSTSRPPSASPTPQLKPGTPPPPAHGTADDAADMTITLSPLQWLLGAGGVLLLVAGIGFALRHRAPPEPPLPPTGVARVFGERRDLDG
jgi:LysM repeat protein